MKSILHDDRIHLPYMNRLLLLTAREGFDYSIHFINGDIKASFTIIPQPYNGSPRQKVCASHRISKERRAYPNHTNKKMYGRL